MEIVRLGPDRYGETARVLSRAFGDDPMWSFLEPDPSQRLRKSAWALDHWSRVLAPLGASWVAEDAGAVVGAALWFPPGKFEVSLGRMLRAGYFRMPVELGFRWMLRSWGIFREGVNHQVALMRQEPHWVLDVLGVDPARQGSGVGGKLIKTGLALADAQGVASFVVTHKKANVGFYERFGFVLVDECRVSGGGPVAYSLRRPVGKAG
ncbi:MAG: GNAT family N-acetyltransferase [Candidatus Hydrogenedentes bacterium]|nr:GNAT family N-acetyltransferase [Candidatus Hydrogenedentota bacterium]